MDQTASADKIIFRHFGNRRKTQIWTAISVYVLVAIMKKRLKLERALHNFTDFKITLFEKIQISWAFEGGTKTKLRLSLN